jgi:hypothetical protein
MASQNIVSDDVVRNSTNIKRKNYNGINIDYTSDLGEYALLNWIIVFIFTIN